MGREVLFYSSDAGTASLVIFEVVVHDNESYLVEDFPCETSPASAPSPMSEKIYEMDELSSSNRRLPVPIRKISGFCEDSRDV